MYMWRDTIGLWDDNNPIELPISIEKKGYAIRIPLKITFLNQVFQSKYDKLRYQSS